MSPSHLLLFAATELLLSMTPGPAVLLVESQGMRRGSSAWRRAAAGILTGNAIYFALSAAASALCSSHRSACSTCCRSRARRISSSSD
jgi:threonine/homoserine/homoserine lactone efflux protein